MVVCNVAWQRDSSAPPFSSSFFIALRRHTVRDINYCTYQDCSQSQTRPLSHYCSIHLLKFPLHTTITTSLTSAITDAEASPQSYYRGEGFAQSVLRHQLHLLPRTRAIRASPDHFKQSNQTKSRTILIYAISATDASSSPDASFDRTREPKHTYKILRLLRPSNTGLYPSGYAEPSTVCRIFV